MAVPETIIKCATSVTTSAPSTENLVIKEFKDAGKSYHEWYHNKKGDSWKAQVKKDINECVKKALSYKEFLRLMKDKGYEINGETFGEGSAKYISFRPYGKDRFVRGRASQHLRSRLYKGEDPGTNRGKNIPGYQYRHHRYIH